MLKQKILVIADIHGRTIWKDIIEKENPDLVIFLGDYVSTHEDISSEQQIENLKEILDYKEENPDNVILLRGNHDNEALGYYWAECSGHDPIVSEWMVGNKERFLADTQWLYMDNTTIFSHAGVSEVWMRETIKPYIDRKLELNSDYLIDYVSLINDLEPDEKFGFTPDSMFDMYGISPTQPLTWIRPQTLARNMIDGYIQVVGHTPVKGECVDIYKATKNHQHLWLCDALGNKSYLVIEDGEFKPKTLNNVN